MSDLGSPWDLHPMDPAYGKHPDVGELIRDEGRRLNERSFAWLDGATNLLVKALDRRARGESERADAFVRRAAAMAYDEREEGWTAVRAASQMVHDLLVDEFEDSDEDDLSWLDPIVAAYASLTGAGRAEVASTVHGFVLQTGFYDPTPAERRRITELFGDAPLEADFGVTPDTPLEQRIAVIDSLLEAHAAVDAAITAAHG